MMKSRLDSSLYIQGGLNANSSNLPTARARFKRTVELHGDIAAVKDNEVGINYRDFFIKVERLSQFFVDNNVQRIILIGSNEVDSYAVMLSCLWGGMQYCPVDGDLNQDKLISIVVDYKPDIIVFSLDEKKVSFLSSVLEKNNLNVMLATVTSLSQLDSNHTAKNATLKPDVPDEHTVLYTIYTSGSTGQPKGVQITRRSLSMYMNWVEKTFPLKSGVKWSQFPNIGFDLSVLDIYGALCHGATLYPLRSRFDRLFPARFIEQHQINIWNSTPSVLDLVLNDPKVSSDSLTSIKFVSVCGEPLGVKTVERFFDVLPDRVLQNTYGPTEATVSCTELNLTISNYKEFCKSSACIGLPINSVDLYLDQKEQKTSEGNALYELIILGDQVALGYLNRDNLNSEKFGRYDLGERSIPYFKTGDLVTYIDGHLYFYSRNDSIVKVRGKFVDIQLVESVFSEITGFDVVTGSNQKHLILFVVGKESHDFSRWVDKARVKLEASMLPTHCQFIPALPTSHNGKLDRKKVAHWVDEYYE